MYIDKSEGMFWYSGYMRNNQEHNCSISKIKSAVGVTQISFLDVDGTPVSSSVDNSCSLL